jgi:hypothetical protein
MDDSANGISAISAQYRFAGMPFGSRTSKTAQQGVMYYSCVFHIAPSNACAPCARIVLTHTRTTRSAAVKVQRRPDARGRDRVLPDQVRL